MSGICDKCKRKPCPAEGEGLRYCDFYEGGETRYERLLPELRREGGEAMSMFSSQCERLRDRADELRMLASGMAAPYIVPETKETMALAMLSAASEMREAADTIESLRDRLQELQGVDNSRYSELFGTPERAANTVLALQVCPMSKDECEECPAYGVCFEFYKDGRTVYEMAEWLRGDAE